MDQAGRLKILMDQLVIATPCNVEWSSMRGNAEKRLCGCCRKHVYNLNAMQPEDALKLLMNDEPEKCVRFRKRADHTIVEGDCPTGLRKHWGRMAKIAIFILAPALLLGCSVATLIQNPKVFRETKFGEYVSQKYTDLKIWLKIEKPKPVFTTMGCVATPNRIFD